MSRLRAWIFVSLARVVFSWDRPMFGATRPTAAQRCAAAKIAAAAKKVRADLTCRAKGTLAGGPPDSACLLKAEQVFEIALSRAQRRGGCVAPGDAGNLAAAIDHGVADLTADATGQCTAGCVEGCSGSFETCRWNGQTCSCGGSLGSCAIECSLLGTSGFCANAGDVCDLGTCSCVAESRTTECDAQKLQATGQELRAELLCRAKATTSDGEVDPACITRAETTFGNAFNKIEDEKIGGGCAARNNALDVLDAAFPWINGIIKVSVGCGWLLQDWNTHGIADPHEFAGIVFEQYGAVMVTDPEDLALLTFDSNGTLVESDQFRGPPSDLQHLAGDFRTTYLILDGTAIGAEGDHGVTWEAESPPGTVLNGIFDIATDASGDVYVVGVAEDSTGIAINFFDKYGFDPACVSCPALLAQARIDFEGFRPVAIAVGANGRIYVGETSTTASGYPDFVVVLASDGTFVSGWPSLERINRMAIDPCGNVLITSSDGQGTIAKYTADGQRITGWSATAPGEISANPSGIAVDGSGNVWTVDWENAAVKEFSCPCTP